MRAAVPGYMKDMDKAPPGHRFGLYFAGWTDEWKLADKEKQKMFSDVTSLGSEDHKHLSALIERQQRAAERMGEAVFSIVARSTAPFVTGMGNEHPLENGFAFLNPYGLPYLPGSSIKGVLRRAAEELVLGREAEGFDMLDIWYLFGFDGNADFLENQEQVRCAFREPDRLVKWLKQILPDTFRKDGLDDPQAFLTALPSNKALRRSLFNVGALNFWDAFPQGSLSIEIMTPHHSDYLQNDGAPHDSEKPNPIPFLTIAPGARFHFFVQNIGDTGDGNWQRTLDQCFRHAWDWLGFGAKTSVGYGAMIEDPAIIAQRRREEEARRKAEAERRQREEEERRAQEAETRRQTELAAMPTHKRMLAEAGQELDGLRKHLQAVDTSGYAKLRNLLKRMVEQAKALDAEGRAEIANWIEHRLDELDNGWRHPDLNAKKRKQWEKKTKETIEGLRRNG